MASMLRGGRQTRGWQAYSFRRKLGVMEFDRITYDPEIMGGQPVIRGMRFPVKTVVRMTAGGMSFSQILEEHPSLQEEDIRQALEYAAARLDGEHYHPLVQPA
ncbi:MAG: DUF433 domain-containing protein [Nesterenkonia sp.]